MVVDLTNQVQELKNIYSGDKCYKASPKLKLKKKKDIISKIKTKSNYK